MTKQEEIREGIKVYCKAYEEGMISKHALPYLIVQYLDSQGVVLKVDTERDGIVLKKLL